MAPARSFPRKSIIWIVLKSVQLPINFKASNTTHKLQQVGAFKKKKP